MRICVVGTGYVGLVTGACLAEIGHIVTCVDKDEERVELLITKLKSPFFEPGLDEIIQATGTTRSHGGTHDEECLLNFTSDLDAALKKGPDVVFICVGTPDRDGRPYLGYVENAVKEVAAEVRLLKLDTAVVVKSTVPPGTCAGLTSVRKYNPYVSIISNPEFLKEGRAVEDFRRPDRIVVGASNEKGFQLMRDVYQHFIRNGHKYLEMDPTSSEMSKYAANAMLATRISFINSIAALCEKVGADVMKVREGIGSDSRIGIQFLYPGLGFGGSCFPKDTIGIASLARGHDLDAPLFNAVLEENRYARERFRAKVITAYQSGCRHFTFWGLSFKPKTSDTRDSVALWLIWEVLQLEGTMVHLYDPVVRELPRFGVPSRMRFYDNKYDALKPSDVLVLATEWAEFRRPDWLEVERVFQGKVILDGRNQWDPKEIRELGFEYHCVGRRAQT